MRRRLVAITMIGLLTLLAGCDQKFPARAPNGPIVESVEQKFNDGPAPKELPKPPETIDQPKDVPANLNGRDLSKEDVDDLRELARASAEKNDYKTALAAQFWAVKLGDDGRYDLACYYARNQMHSEAIYWIQKAAEAEGVDAEHALQDEDLETLRRDARWAGVHRYLRQCSAYWTKSGRTATLVYLPENFDSKKPSPVIMTLHGRGSRPDHFFGTATQALANQLGIPFICVSGTNPTGPKSFVWAVAGNFDAKRLDAALAEAADRITPAPGKVITLGFSEGAQVALEVAARDPEKYAGGIGMSPGADFFLDKFSPSPKLKERRFVVTIGSKEALGNVALAREDRNWLKVHAASVNYVTFPGIAHTLPADFNERLPKWVSYILDTKK